MDEWKKTALERAACEANAEISRIDKISEELNVNFLWLAGEILKSMKKRLDELKNQ